MTALPPAYSFRPYSPDAANVLSWAHVGDLYMLATRREPDKSGRKW